MSTPRYSPACHVLRRANAKPIVVVAGGSVGPAFDLNAVNSVEVFDLETMSWSNGKPIKSIL